MKPLHILTVGACLIFQGSLQAVEAEVLYSFQVAPRSPGGSLVEGIDGTLYGTSQFGGKYGGGGQQGFGTIFKVKTNGLLTTLHSFDNTNGAQPEAGLAWGPDGHLYGTTAWGGRNNHGTVFRITTNGVFSLLFSFEYHTSGMGPRAALTLGDDGNFYGTTRGWFNWRFPNPGAVFRVTTNGIVTTLGSVGASPSGLVLGPDGDLYGTTAYGGAGNDVSDGAPTVFKVSKNGVTAVINNSGPGALKLTLAKDGNFYGTTEVGGTSNFGTVFRMSTDGVLTTLFSFTDADGMYPQAGLLLADDGKFFGVTKSNLFTVTTNGLLAVVSLKRESTAPAITGLMLAQNGYFYGVTELGGKSDRGTVFRLTTNAVWTTLADFDEPNGVEPHGGLVLGNDGNFYGTTVYGGSHNLGTVFQITPSGVLTSLAAFNNTNGANPFSGLVLGHDGNFYGTTANGGSG